MNVGSLLFVLAVAHTLAANRFVAFAKRWPLYSPMERTFHLLGEVEVIFGFWAGVFVLWSVATLGFDTALNNLSSLSFAEPCFVATIMIVAATRPIIDAATALIVTLARFLPLPFLAGLTACCLVVGPLLGSLITEPAAMTVTALIIRQRLFDHGFSGRLKYSILGTLFVNVSIGGVLTHFAAPPVVMVARTWGWTTPFMMAEFGSSAVIAVVINAALIVTMNWKELAARSRAIDVAEISTNQAQTRTVPIWVTTIHLIALAAIVLTSHYPAFFAGVLVFFIGSTVVTGDFQTELRLKEGLLVGFFLAGLVVLGHEQSWWVSPLIPKLSPLQLFTGSAALTAVLDNAAITYLASQVPNIADALKYAVVSGAVVGGGLTVIANAPNPVGFALLRDSFDDGSISPLKLFLAAALPTAVAGICFWLLF